MRIMRSDCPATKGLRKTVKNETPIAITIIDGFITPLEIPSPAITKLNSPICALLTAAKYASRQRTPPSTMPQKQASVWKTMTASEISTIGNQSSSTIDGFICVPIDTKNSATNRFLNGSVMFSTRLETSEPEIIEPAIKAPSDNESFDISASSPSPIIRQKITIISSCLFPDTANLRNSRGTSSLPTTNMLIIKLSKTRVERSSSPLLGSSPDESPESTTSRNTAKMSSIISMPIAICA